MDNIDSSADLLKDPKYSSNSCSSVIDWLCVERDLYYIVLSRALFYRFPRLKATHRRLRRIVGDWTFDFFNGWPFFGESTDLLSRHEDKEVSMSRVFSTFGFGFDCLTSKSIPFAPKSFDWDGFNLIGLARKIFITAQSSKNENIKRIPVTHPDTNIQFESDDLKFNWFLARFRCML